jgi:hypothetical protein
MKQFSVYAKLLNGKILVGVYEADSEARAVWHALQQIHSEDFVFPSPTIVEDEEVAVNHLVAYPVPDPDPTG